MGRVLNLSGQSFGHNGESVTVAELARTSGVPAGILAWRLNNAWTVEEAISIPIAMGGRPRSAIAKALSRDGKGPRSRLAQRLAMSTPI